MTPVQLAKAECCNYFSTGPYGVPDYCPLYRRCRVVTAAKTPCTWFVGAVAPQDDQAKAEYNAVISDEAPPIRPAQRHDDLLVLDVFKRTPHTPSAAAGSM